MPRLNSSSPRPIISPKTPRNARSPKTFKYPYDFEHVYQFEIVLNNIEPKIWRRIQVPNTFSFWDLHCAITDSLGWLDYHLHLFTMKNPKTGKTDRIGIPDKEDADMLGYKVLPSWGKRIGQYFNLNEKPNTTCKYDYDFGDGWEHVVTLEDNLEKEKGAVYPRCIAGERACPPEDVGGVPGYERFATAVKYQNAVDHDELLQWVGGWFDPDWFDLSLVRFEDPDLRWDIAFHGAKPKKGMRMVQYHHLHK